MSYAILRFEKRKGGIARVIESHHERQKEEYFSNPDIDNSLSEYNYHLLKPKKSYHQEINQRIEKAKCKVRSNSVKFVDTLITSDSIFFKKHSGNEYFKMAFDFMCEKVGKQNIISAVVHNDEKTPHMHLCFTPITSDGRLSAKEILGNKLKMKQWQDEFYKYMQTRFRTLQRGKSAEVTKRQHIPTHLFKQADILSKELKTIQDIIQDMNFVNIGKKRDEAIRLLKEWFPKASVFVSEIETLKGVFSRFKDNETFLQAEIADLKSESKNQKEQYDELESRASEQIAEITKAYQSYKEFTNSIPKDIFNQLKNNYWNQKKEQEEKQKVTKETQQEEYEQEWGEED